MMRTIVLSVLGLMLTLPGYAATDWTVDHGESRLGFTNWWEGEAFESMFRRWRAETLRFSPDDLQDSRFDIRVDLTSVDTGTRDGNEAIAQPEWFDLARYTTARYEADTFRVTVDGGYEAEGELTLKGITHPVTLKLEWQPGEDTARLSGSTRLDRTRFDVGLGEWQTGDTIALEVQVSFDLRLTRAGR
ncbi:MAG: YceI family protein [Gammaproteobacteria bacterium]|nr:YceI family protein [Gammaproteobacteria bacterium]